ncbi:VWA domain-containing protein [Streptomyces sp. NPDC046887]|uniref:VWA domain-containing protein n=1 Tax=Streptomyces sp. NPDC046887 TaxID=3155472 RepID=UPI0033E47E74
MGIRSLLRKVFSRDRAESEETATVSVPPQTGRAVPQDTPAPAADADEGGKEKKEDEGEDRAADAGRADDGGDRRQSEDGPGEDRPDTVEPGTGGEGSGADRPSDEPTASRPADAPDESDEFDESVVADASEGSDASDGGGGGSAGTGTSTRTGTGSGGGGGSRGAKASGGTEPVAASSGAAASSVTVPSPAAPSPAEQSAADLVAASFDQPRARRAQVPAARDETVPERDQDEQREAEPKAGIPAQTSPSAPERKAEPEPTAGPATEPAVEPAPEQETAPEAKPVPKKSEKAAEKKSAEKSAEQATEKSAEKAPEKPAGKAAEKPAGKETGNPAAEKPTAKPAAEKATAKPAFTLARVKSRAPQLAEAYKAAGAVLRKQGLTGARATVYLVLDRSGSMRSFYKDGGAQHLAEQALALAAHLDERATVPVVFFSTEVDGTGEVSLEDVEGRIEALHDELGRMGRTHYEQAIEEVRRLHAASEAAGGPALVVFQTDGAPESRTAATKALAEAAEGSPEIEWRFVAFGEKDAKAFDYLRKLQEDGAERFGFQHAGPAPAEVPHATFYRELLADWTPAS